MSHLSSWLIAVCLLPCACASDVNGADGAGGEPLQTAGTGGGDALSLAGDIGSGGTPSAAGAGSGPSAEGGSLAMGGSEAVAGAPSALGGSAGTTAQGGSAGTTAQGGAPAAAPIDFGIWSLQLPTGSGTSPTTIPPATLLKGYMDDYFYLAPDGGQMFMDPQMGITTSGSMHCRTEMRENKASGGQAAWASSGTNTMTVTGKMIQVGGDSVTVGQVFNSDDSIPLCELEYSKSKKGFTLFYEEAKGGGGSPTDLKTPVALMEQYKFVLSLTKGVLTVKINDKQVYTHNPSAGILAKSFYFKFGNYDQSSTRATAASKTPYSVVEAYTVDVVHQ